MFTRSVKKAAAAAASSYAPTHAVLVLERNKTDKRKYNSTKGVSPIGISADVETRPL